MPEGPEIRRAADRIAKVLEGQKVETVAFGLPRLSHYDEQLSGRKVLNLETRGKALLTHFDNGLSIYSHNQLYGRWYVVKRDNYPATSRSLRLALHTGTHSALLYSASDITVMPTDELAMHPFLARIGPDILDATLTWRDVSALLLAPERRRRKLAGLYLDQTFMAGIGNYLRSEILFDAGINPDVRPADLSRKQVNDLARSTLAISKRAYDTGGITNPPRRVAQLKKAGQKRRGYRHAVFGRVNQPCYQCGEAIVKETLAGRRLYYCPLCQY
jgi:endonuclease-8